MKSSGIWLGAVCLTMGTLGCERERGSDAGYNAPRSGEHATEQVPHGTTVTQPEARTNARVAPEVAAATAPTPPATEIIKEFREADARLESAKGVELRGEVEFEETVDGVKIEVDIEAGPAGIKGMHIHEKGDCSDIPDKSMGPHFAGGHDEHGLPESVTRHLGDLGNVTIDASGEGKVSLTVKGANLRPGDPHSFFGRAIVIHAEKDLGPGDPSGKSGAPIACGVIVADKD